MNNNSNLNNNILFYSKNCKTCNLFINNCHKNNLLKHFQMVCIDEKIQEYSARGLKVVPTLYIKGYAKPIEGKNVFQWLESTLSLNNANSVANTNNINNTNNTNNLNNTNNTNNLKNSNNLQANIKVRSVQIDETPILPIKNKNRFENKEENIIKNDNINKNDNNIPIVKKQPIGYLKDEMDGFSDPFAYLSTDNPLPKSFVTCDKDTEIYTAPEGPKIDWKKQQEMIKKLERDRDDDKTDFVCGMNLQQKQILYDANKKINIKTT